MSTVRSLCEAAGATEIRAADDPAERAGIWAGRKSAFAAVGRISPAYIVQDGVVPRTSLGAVLAQIASLSAESGIRVANVFHAGDGNLHPLVLYDDAVPGEAEAAEKVSGAILDACLEQGGSITGEHGVGVDKSRYMPKMFGCRRPGHHAAGPLRVRPGQLVQPRQDLPHAPAVRRGPRPPPGAASRRSGRAGGDLLVDTERSVVPAARDALVAACPVVRKGVPASDAVARGGAVVRRVPGQHR